MRRRRDRDAGAAAVELALVLPVLLLVVFGIIDFGRMLNAQLTLTEAAREGARAEALGADPATRVHRASADLGTVGTTVASACPDAPGPDDDAVVKATYTFQFVTPVGSIASIFGGHGLSGGMALSGQGVMPCLH